MSKLGVHVSAGNRSGFGDFLRRCAEAGSPVPVIFAVDQNVWPDVQQFSPQTIVIFRHQPRDTDGSGLDAPGGMYHTDPIQTAQNWMSRLMPKWRQNPAHYYAPINEQDAGILEHYAWLDTFTQECLRVADANGFKLALYAFSSGNPRDDVVGPDGQPIVGGSTLEQKWEKLLPSMRYAKANGHILLLHEYGFKSPAANGGPATSLRASAPDLALRYRRSYHYLHQFNADPPLVISEASAGAGGFAGLGQTRWLADAIWYDSELMRDRVVLGCCLYQVGGTENIREVLPALGAYIAATPTPEPSGEPTPIEPPVEPVPYVVTVHLLPQDTQIAEAQEAMSAAYAQRQSITFSADDARRLVATGQPGSKVIVWAPQRWTGGDIAAYLGVPVEIRQFTGYQPPSPEPAPDGTAWRGLHMRADGNSGLLDFEALRVARCNAAKIMTNTSFDEMSRLLASGINPARIVLRLFADFRGRRVLPNEFIEWQRLWLAEFERCGGRYVEVHNEPNLPDEGLGTSWQNAAGFAGWYGAAVNLIRANWPTLLVGYPGLSPQPGVDTEWLPTIRALINMNQCDWIGAHSYWQTAEQMGHADHGRYYERFLALGRQVIITEFSNVNGAVTHAEKGRQYKAYYASLPLRVLGAFAFVSSASEPAFNTRRETWVMNGSLTDIPREVGR